MAYNNNKEPLYKRTHWRAVRDVVNCIAEYENITTSEYDLEHFKCYETIGDNLKGKTVSYSTADNSSIWVSDNNYEIYEAPKKNNSEKYNFTGEFLFLAHNTTWDYWLFGTMSDHIDFNNSQVSNTLIENVSYAPTRSVCSYIWIR